MCIFALLTANKLYAQSNEICSLKLFPDDRVTQLYWENPGESFVVGFGSAWDSEFAREYHVVNYDKTLLKFKAITIRDLTMF